MKSLTVLSLLVLLGGPIYAQPTQVALANDLQTDTQIGLTDKTQAIIIEKKAIQDADLIHTSSAIEDIATHGPSLLALTGKEVEMPKVMKDTLVKRRAFHLCRSHGFSAPEENSAKIRLLAPVAADKDYTVVQWLEGNLEPLSATKASHRTATNENERGRHEASGPFAVFSHLNCAR
jgi:hypothetical protein